MASSHAEEAGSTVNTGTTSSLGSPGTPGIEFKRNDRQCDSFASLTSLMKAKKPYAYTPSPSPRLEPLTSASSDRATPVLPQVQSKDKSPSLADHAIKERDLVAALANSQKIIHQFRLNSTRDQRWSGHLQEELKSLREKFKQMNIDRATEKIRDAKEESYVANEEIRKAHQEIRKLEAERDRFWAQAEQAQQQVAVLQTRLSASLGNGSGNALRGAIHLVAPNETSKLPKKVLQCFECYANNLECDEGACCRNCYDRNERCTRWRCSLKHKLGECNMVPCAHLHDDQGWLMLKNARPVW